jgi:hypothetical protein
MRRASALSFHGGPEFHPGVDPRLGRFLVDALSPGRFGGVKRAPRGYSMGQMGQRARHG